jgi:ribosomal protein S18 acetylase RimI-like enzyme
MSGDRQRWQLGDVFVLRHAELATTIRPGREDELPEIRALGLESHIAAYGDRLSGPDLERVHAAWWSDEVLTSELRQGLVLVAEDETGRLVGVVSAEPHGKREWVLWKLYVLPGLQSQGLGSRLLNALLERLPEDIATVVLDHYAFNTEAARFYDRHGFAIEKTALGSLETEPTEIIWRRRWLHRPDRSSPD